MALEHPDYRANIEQLNLKFPDREMLTLADVAEVYGYKNPGSARYKFGCHLQLGKISKAKLARLMCMTDTELKRAGRAAK